MFVVAGVTGHVGSAVAKELIDQGKPIRVLVRDEAKGATWSSQGIETRVGTLDDAGFLTRALDGAAGFFTLLPEDPAAADFHGTRRQIADATADAVQASGVPHVVIVSSAGADAAEGNGPIQDLHYLEERLRATGTTLTAVRASYFQENLAGALVPARQAGIVPSFAPSDAIPMPMTATKDVGRLAARCLITPPRASEVIDIEGPTYTMREVADRLGRALGRDLQVVAIPESEWIPSLLRAGMSPSAAAAIAEMFYALGKGLIGPRGDRAVRGMTPIDDVIRALVTPAA